MHTLTKVGLDALLTPENCAVLLIDHQPSQLANVNSHDPTMVINNVTALAKTAKAFGVPTILTTINVKRGGELFKQVQAVFPDQKPIDRTFINSWEDRRVVEAVKNTGRKKLVIAALWSEMCLAQPAIHAMGDGYDVYAVADAAGLGHMGIHRNVIHPRFGNFILLGTVLIAAEATAYDQPLSYNPCLECKLCVAACPVGAISPDGRFNFSACYTHNYREFLGGFTDWVEQVADSKSALDYRKRVADTESASLWQSLFF